MAAHLRPPMRGDGHRFVENYGFRQGKQDVCLR